MPERSLWNQNTFPVLNFSLSANVSPISLMKIKWAPSSGPNFWREKRIEHNRRWIKNLLPALREGSYSWIKNLLRCFLSAEYILLLILNYYIKIIYFCYILMSTLTRYKLKLKLVVVTRKPVRSFERSLIVKSSQFNLNFTKV